MTSPPDTPSASIIRKPPPYHLVLFPPTKVIDSPQKIRSKLPAISVFAVRNNKSIVSVVKTRIKSGKYDFRLNFNMLKVRHCSKFYHGLTSRRLQNITRYSSTHWFNWYCNIDIVLHRPTTPSASATRTFARAHTCVHLYRRFPILYFSPTRVG